MDSPLVIPFFIPHQGCPHQCVFCNQSVITGQRSTIDLAGIDGLIGEYLGFKGQRKRVEFAFFGGNFFGLPRKQIRGLLSRVKPYVDEGLIHGIRCSTRPDTISREILDMVTPFGLDLVEIGVQSMDDHVLKHAGRGHSRKDTLKAMAVLNEAGMKTGVQVMVGLPGDSLEKALDTAVALAALKPDVARIYPLLVLAGSKLACWYEKGRYLPLSLDQAVDQVKAMFEIFNRAGVPVARMGLQAGEMMEDANSMLAGPWHPAFGHLVYSRLMLEQVLRQVAAPGHVSDSQHIQLKVNPRALSRLQGDKKANLEQLARTFPECRFSIAFDDALALDQVVVT